MKTRNQKHVPGLAYIPTMAEQEHERKLREQRIARAAKIARITSEQDAKRIISLCARMGICQDVRTRKFDAYCRIANLDL